MERSLYVGLDIGSTTVKVAGIDDGGQLAGEPVYLRHDAFPSPIDALKYAFRRYLDTVAGTAGRVRGVGVTGSGRALVAHLVGADLTRSEILAHAAGVLHLVGPGAVGSVVEIGGQDSKVIVFGEDGIPSFFNMNTICSAGTGEFLKQLADEAGLTLEEFGRIALESRHPVTIDATCTVFSRRDFRHLTQKGVPLADRLMGVCHALVRNYLVNVVQQMKLPSPVFFQGGVALNPAVRRALAERLGVPVHLTPHGEVIGAIGMAVLVRDEDRGEPQGRQRVGGRFREDFFDRRFQTRMRYCHGCRNACELAQGYEQTPDGTEVVLDTLGGRCDGSRNPKNIKDYPQPLTRPHLSVIRDDVRRRRDRPVEMGHRHAAWISGERERVRSSAGRYVAGIDGGSRGTKYALLRSLGEGQVEIVAVGALETGGDAVRACLRAMARIQEALPPGERLAAVGTTGSAGELFRDMLIERVGPEIPSADYRSTEILAHYAWASYRVPDVGTVMDIGGNDAKIIVVKEGGQGGLDFAMNDKCAAGTGAFLEAVARRFHVPIEKFASVALEATNPARIAGRCAVFGESDVIHKARVGFTTPDLFLGAAFSVCRTYLSDVARGHELRLPVVAQGGTFLNAAVVHAFREMLELGPEEFRLAEDPREVLGAGALGAALLALGRWEQGFESRFKGFGRILSSQYETITVTCSHPGCLRRCRDLVVLLENGEPIAGYRSVACERGFFDGPFESREERDHVVNLLRAHVDAVYA
ncbi:MAG TPA: hypothetical protein GXX55_09605 [Firmicutes bacterium]|nr:hypothetical protein [Bacillota bacterium]